MRLKTFAALALALTWPGALPAQTAQSPNPSRETQAQGAQTQPAPKPDSVIPAAQGPAPTSQANPGSYKVGSQDQLKITVFDEPDLTTSYRVDADGFINFPLIGRISASGATLADLQQRITTALANGYIRNPQVRIEVDQYKSQSVYVIGEVRSPGKITMTGSAMTLLEALALAGSPTAQASNEVIVVHPKRPNAVPGAPDANIEGARITVNRKDLELGKAGQDVVLQDGDIINVPVAQRFYISGLVRNPGFYVLDPGMSIQQAIALAGGLNERGSDRRITVTRLVKGKTTEVKVELDDKVQANDTINIPARFF